MLPIEITSLLNLETLILEDCISLTSLPTNIHKLVKLSYLGLDVYSNLNSLPDLTLLPNLRTLGAFIVYQSEDLVMLGNMEQLRGTLGISRLENVSNVIAAQQALLNKKKDVKKLHLGWNTTADETVAFFVLKGLELHMDLMELQIFGYGGRNFPIWIGDPSFYNLARITFSGFERCVSLPYLGQLPNLKLLSLHRLSRLAQIDADVMSGLPFLDTLTISDMPNLTV
uniref:R13L1/DRL21-like LRR repeat region domain-containing protein n=1 Tax=Fagus sylvatica TaxID=28930 RepID=A0A2N9IZ40_FAGSY